MDNREDNRIKTVCFTGHRDLPEAKKQAVYAALQKEVALAIEEGYDTFISGFANGVDIMAAEIVAEYKKKNPLLLLYAYLPYFERVLQKKPAFQTLLKACDMVKIVRQNYDMGSYHARNRLMVDHADLLIAVYDGRKEGGTYQTISYAKRKGRKIVIIGI